MILDSLGLLKLLAFLMLNRLCAFDIMLPSLRVLNLACIVFDFAMYNV